MKGEETGRITTADLMGATQSVVEKAQAALMAVAAEPAESVKVVKVEESSNASIGVYRGIEREVYEVPRSR